MRKTSVRELHIHTSELVREAEDGSVIVIERRGQPVAELRPVTPAPQGITPEKKGEIFARMQEFWGHMPLMPDSTDAVSEDRDR